MQTPSIIAQQLEQELNAVFDPELVLNLAKKITSSGSSYAHIQPLGCGRHVQCYKMNLSGLPSVLKIPRHQFDELFPVELNETWFLAMADLAKQRPPLVPPFKVIAFNHGYLQIMPFLEVKKITTGELNTLESELGKDLASLGLRNNDALQIGFYKGIPFALDLSDIKRI